MSNISKKKKELKDKIPKVVMDETVPEDIKMVFGKFCAYSFLYVGFFGVIYPFFLMYYLDKLFSIGLIVGLIVFYGFIIFDTLKKAGKYKSNSFFFMVMFVVLVISLSIIRLIF